MRINRLIKLLRKDINHDFASINNILQTYYINRDKEEHIRNKYMLVNNNLTLYQDNKILINMQRWKSIDLIKNNTNLALLLMDGKIYNYRYDDNKNYQHTNFLVPGFIDNIEKDDYFSVYSYPKTLNISLNVYFSN